MHRKYGQRSHCEKFNNKHELTCAKLNKSASQVHLQLSQKWGYLETIECCLSYLNKWRSSSINPKIEVVFLPFCKKEFSVKSSINQKNKVIFCLSPKLGHWGSLRLSSINHKSEVVLHSCQKIKVVYHFDPPKLRYSSMNQKIKVIFHFANKIRSNSVYLINPKIEVTFRYAKKNKVVIHLAQKLR